MTQQTLVLLSYQQHWVVQVATVLLFRNRVYFFYSTPEGLFYYNGAVVEDIF
jgi:hypothetical protein